MKFTKVEVKEKMVELKEFTSFQVFIVNTQKDCVLRIKVTFDSFEFKVKDLINNIDLTVAEFGKLCDNYFIVDNNEEAQQLLKEIKKEKEKEFKKELLADF